MEQKERKQKMNPNSIKRWAVTLADIFHQVNESKVRDPILQVNVVAINTLLHQTTNNHSFARLDCEEQAKHIEKILPLCSTTVRWLESLELVFTTEGARDEADAQICHVWRIQNSVPSRELTS